MDSVLSDEKKNVVRMKQKPSTQKATKDAGGEETHSFLNFSRENLSISNSDLEQGFNKARFRVRRHTLLSAAAFILALACIGIEIWKLKSVVENAKQIEILKRDVETLKHRLLEEDLLDELKAFEEKLYAEEGNGDEDDPELENIDYDSNYDDEIHDYTDDYQISLPTTRSLDISHAPKTSSTSDKDLEEILEALRNVKDKRGQNLKKCVRENLKDTEVEELPEEERRYKDEVTTTMTIIKINSSDFENVSDAKQKRSIEIQDPLDFIPDDISTHDILSKPINNKPRKSNIRLNQDSIKLKSKKNPIKEIENVPTGPDVFQRSDVLGKRYSKNNFAKTQSDVMQSTTSKNHQISEVDSEFKTLRKEMSGIKKNTERMLLKEVKQDSTRIQKLKENLEEAMTSRSLHRGLTRRHLKVPRQVYAVHYGADSNLFTDDDEHTGNGRAKHSEGVFKAWKPSDWVGDLGMSKHFFLSDSGKLTVQEPGLYLAYAQIHYLDEHDENGFHMLVNGRPILQCMLYSPGRGHKSRSCFSAQIAVLESGDHVVLKDVGPARYTLFQKDKSFFGLVKLGDWRQPQKQQHSVTP